MKKKYIFKTNWRKEWGDDYDVAEIVTIANNYKEAEEKAWKIYRDNHNGEWDSLGYHRQLIELIRTEEILDKLDK